jgi:hypothetical protein
MRYSAKTSQDLYNIEKVAKKSSKIAALYKQLTRENGYSAQEGKLSYWLHPEKRAAIVPRGTKSQHLNSTFGILMEALQENVSVADETFADETFIAVKTVDVGSHSTTFDKITDEESSFEF